MTAALIRDTINWTLYIFFFLSTFFVLSFHTSFHSSRQLCNIVHCHWTWWWRTYYWQQATLGVNNDIMLREVTTKQIPLFIRRLTMGVWNAIIRFVLSMSQFTRHVSKYDRKSINIYIYIYINYFQSVTAISLIYFH
jgi:hypothetical protein